MATTPAVGAACLLALGPGRADRDRTSARLRRLRRVVRGRCVAELSREGPAPRPAPAPAQLAPPVVPSFLAPPRPEPARAPASTPPPVPDSGEGDLALQPEGIAEDPMGRTILVAGAEDAENLVIEEQAKATVTHNIVFVTGEASPYAKSGGLGDVCGSLPVALAARGHRVMVVMPRYLNGTNDKNYANAFYTAKHIKIPCFGGEHEVTFFHEYRDSVDWGYIQKTRRS